MLFGNMFGNKERPRRFIYTPRYYDPETDREPSARIRFDKSPFQRSSRRRFAGGSWTMLVVVIIIIVLIAVLQKTAEREVDLSGVELSPADAAPVETATQPQNDGDSGTDGYIETP
jgi:hypothetical protein